MTNNMSVAIFSKNRALQLELLLSSFLRHCKNKKMLFDNAAGLKINVLYKASDNHQGTYNNLKVNFNFVNFVEEKNFKADLVSLVSGSDFTFFLCDDSIFCNDFDLKEIMGILSDQGDLYSSNAIGFSMRLGVNTHICYPVDREQKITEYIPAGNTGQMMVFDWTTSEYDFKYPLELSSSIYKTNLVMPILENSKYNNPNDLEWAMHQLGFRFEGFKPYLFAYQLSRAFCNPVNKVQTVNDNRSGKLDKYSVDKLLEVYKEGYWIDASKFDGFVSSGCHQEVEFEFVTEVEK